MGFDVPGQHPQRHGRRRAARPRPCDRSGARPSSTCPRGRRRASRAGRPDAGPARLAPPVRPASALARSGARLALVSVPGGIGVRRGHRRRRRGLRRDDLQRQRARASRRSRSSAPPSHGGAGDGPRLRHGGGRRPWARLRQRGAARAGGDRGRVRHRLPAGLTLLDAAGVGVRTARGRQAATCRRRWAASPPGRRCDARRRPGHRARSWSCPSRRRPRSRPGSRSRRPLSTPVRFALLGASRPDLTAAVGSCVEAGRRPVPECWTWGTSPPADRTGRLRGLFVGGTLCDEAMIIAVGPRSAG